jgi:hypothetical protein
LTRRASRYATCSSAPGRSTGADSRWPASSPWILLHPEYHGVLSLPGKFREKDYTDESNPFLHMSLHVALEEQLSIDQPPGIVARWRELLARHGDRHEALHQAIECLAETMWRARRDNAPPDAAAYLACLGRGRRA